MTAPTLDDARAWLRECVGELEEVAHGYTETGEDVPARWPHYAACARLALAALDDAERWRQAGKQAAAWVMATPEFIAQMEGGWSEPVRVQITRRVAEDVLEFEAERHYCDAARREGA